MSEGAQQVNALEVNAKQMLDRVVIGRLEEICGRVPTDQEIREHLRWHRIDVHQNPGINAAILVDWKDRTIIQAVDYKAGSSAIRIVEGCGLPPTDMASMDTLWPMGIGI